MTLAGVEPSPDAPVTGLAEWQALACHAGQMRGMPLSTLLDQRDRFAGCARRHGDLLVDFSRQRVTHETFDLLIDLARARRLPEWVDAMFDGVQVNVTEHRAALHTALRRPPGPSLMVDGRDLMPAILGERRRMLDAAEAIRRGDHRGAGGRRIRRVVNIGIGGSDLGLVMVVEALRDIVTPEIRFDFVSNVDGQPLADVLCDAEPAETLFVICSKSFTTLETQLNATIAREWLVAALGETAVARHFLAVSVNDAAMDRFGIAPSFRFPIGEWVGGRYSLWSSVGLAIAIAVGVDAFVELLAGAHDMDEHFRRAPLRDNLPVLLGLVGIWNHNHLDADTHVILPYDSRLHRLPAYLQQLEMESNGKRVTRTGAPLACRTAPVIWGEPGSNAQHSFFQLLHQGTAHYSADFIATAATNCRYPDLHLHALANMMAQAEALARGHGVAADGTVAADADPHRVHPGNHASTVILMRRLAPRALGSLIALYEHKVYVQAIIWGINPFDQWGVELGKRMAVSMHALLQGEAQHGSETPLAGLVAAIRAWRPPSPADSSSSTENRDNT